MLKIKFILINMSLVLFAAFTLSGCSQYFTSTPPEVIKPEQISPAERVQPGQKFPPGTPPPPNYQELVKK